MSLVHAANHLAAQGRGEDTHLVHMTSKELAAMQKLAESQGKSLTINPKTGLPEAGMLSTVLPMALGALAVATGQVELLPYIAAGVGAADYAITGSLSQGLMAGLGTWSGGTLAGGLGAAGAAEIAAEGGNAATAAYEKSLEQIGANGAQIPAGAIPTEMGTYNPATGAEVTTQSLASDAVSKAGLKAAQESALQQAIQAGGNTSEIVGAAGRLGTTPTITEGLARGISSPSAIGETIMNNKMALAGAAAPLLSGLTKQPTVPGTTQQKNPFGMKEIPRDENGKPIFNASIPTQPNPAYKPVYPDYIKNPYVAGAAAGGLMDKTFAAGGMYPGSQIDKTQYATSPQTPMSMQATMAGYDPATNPLTGEPTTHMASGGIPSYKGSPDYGSMVENIGEVERGIEMATKRKVLDDRQMPVEIAADEPELARLDPHNRARKMLEMLSGSSKVKLAKGLPQSNVLGAINIDPAKVVAEQRAKEAIAAEQPTEAKEGGLMAAGGQAHLGDYSDGGHLLRGPGDGVSDSIPATIGGKQPARLATGEFVVPARIVSELGNGSTDAGAKRLYAMMDRIKAKRAKTKNIAADTKAYKYLPA